MSRASHQTQPNPADMQPWCFPPFPPLLLSQLLPENTDLLHHLQLLPEALHLLLYVLELILLHPQQHLGQRRGRGTRGDSRATASERLAGPGASTAVEKEGRARRAGAGNGASSLREQRRGGLCSASCTVPTAPFGTSSHLLRAKAIKKRRPPGWGGMEAAGQPGDPCTSSSQELRSLLCEARSPELRDEIKLRSFPISSDRRVCSSCRQSQKMSQ